MKRWLVLFAVLFCTESILCSCTPDQYPVKEPYQYRVFPGTTAWDSMSNKAARQEACQVDSELLHQMTTEALIETILAYPFFIDIFAFDTLELGFAMVSPPGLSILLEREDASHAIQSVSETWLQEFGADSTEWLYAHTLQEYLSRRDISSS